MALPLPDKLPAKPGDVAGLGVAAMFQSYGVAAVRAGPVAAADGIGGIHGIKKGQRLRGMRRRLVAKR